MGEWEDDGWSFGPSKEEQKLNRSDNSAALFFDDAGDWGSSQDDWASDWSYSNSKKAPTKGKGRDSFVKNAGFIKDDSLPSASSLFTKPQSTEVSQHLSNKSAEVTSKQSGSDDWDDADWESPVAPTDQTSTVHLKAENIEWTDDAWETLNGTGWEPVPEVKSTRQQREERRLKQQAERQKKSAEVRTSKAMKLGAVKKSD